MSVITFYDQAELAPAAQSIWRPLTDALGDFAPAFARTLGAIIAFVAAVLPVVVFVLLSLAVLIFCFRWSGRRRARKADRLIAMEKATSSANS